jgi:hypothetical protein
VKPLYMDKRNLYRMKHELRLETYVKMAGMTIYRNEQTNQIADIIYDDFSYGDPKEAWDKRREKVYPYPEEEQLADKTCDRYYLEYYDKYPCERYSNAWYKTDESIANELKERAEKEDERAEKSRLKAQEKALRREGILDRQRDRRRQTREVDRIRRQKFYETMAERNTYKIEKLDNYHLGLLKAEAALEELNPR